MDIGTAGMVAEWAAFAVEDVKGFALLDTDDSRTVGGHMIVQHVIDSVLHLKTETWVESAEPAMCFACAGREHT